MRRNWSQCISEYSPVPILQHRCVPRGPSRRLEKRPALHAIWSISGNRPCVCQEYWVNLSCRWLLMVEQIGWCSGPYSTQGCMHRFTPCTVLRTKSLVFCRFQSKVKKWPHAPYKRSGISTVRRRQLGHRHHAALMTIHLHVVCMCACDACHTRRFPITICICMAYSSKETLNSPTPISGVQCMTSTSGLQRIIALTWWSENGFSSSSKS